MKDWNPEEAKQALDLEMYPTQGESKKTSEDIARAKLTNAVALASDSLIHLMLYSDNEGMRYKAAVEILNRVLGKATDLPLGAANKDKELDKFIKTINLSSS
jgi:hypothetical protein